MSKDRPKVFDIFKRQAMLFFIIICIVFSMIVIRLFVLQVLEGDIYRQKSEKNRLRVYDISPSRGFILDRNGYVLASNDVSFALYIIPSEFRTVEPTGKVLAAMFGMDPEGIATKVNRERKLNPYAPILIKKGLKVEELSYILAHSLELPGIYIEERSKRIYPLSSLMSHVLGYVGEINQKELDTLGGMGYKVGDVIGKMGVERLKEDVLKGKRGGSIVETDALGRTVKEIAKVPPSMGEDVQLALDYQLQEIVEAELEGKRGAVVCMDPMTGQILAMASAPSFDPNVFVDGVSHNYWRSLTTDPSKPLLNRAVSGIYPLGSVFKIVVAVAALEEGVTDEREVVYCTGSFRFGNRDFGCWKEHGHGPVNLRRALVESCDFYFYEMGRRLGVDKISTYARLLGLGSSTGTGLLEEKEGVVPSSEWKKKTLKAPWYPGETISYAIGQGYLAITPIQVAIMISAIFNGGYLHKARLTLDPVDEQRPYKLPIKDRTLELIKDALWGVVNEPRGTGSKARVEGWDVSGKTGTAQTRSLNIVEKDINRVPYHLRDHAWFAAVAPKEDPQLTVVVLIEHGGHGGSAAAPVAGKIFDWYFNTEGR